MNGKVKLLALGIITMIAISGLAAYTVIANNTGSDPIRVACVGDSITEGSGYPDKLQTLLGSNYNVRNFGVSGSTVSQHSTLPYIDQIEFRKAEDFNPEIVVI